MADNLVIVESPAKAKTIQKFLGNGYVVKTSFGHIRDLQDKKLSVDVERDFTPEYVIPADKKKVVAELKKAAESASTVCTSSRLSGLMRSTQEGSCFTKSRKTP